MIVHKNNFSFSLGRQWKKPWCQAVETRKINMPLLSLKFELSQKLNVYSISFIDNRFRTYCTAAFKTVYYIYFFFVLNNILSIFHELFTSFQITKVVGTRFEFVKCIFLGWIDIPEETIEYGWKIMDFALTSCDIKEELTARSLNLSYFT